MTDRDKLMHRTRAAVAFCNTSNDPATDMHAFMALFHPEVPQERVRELARDARDKARGRR